MNTKKLLRILLIITVLLVIFGIIGKKAGWFGGTIVYKVAVEEASYKNIIETITANGRIQPETEVKISPDVSGEIVALTAVEGQDVKVGGLLVKIKQDFYISSRDRVNASVNSSKANLANAKAALAQSEAQFKQQELAFKRSQTLYQQGVLSVADYETAESQYQVSEAQVEAARQQVAAATYSVKSAEASLKEAEENLRKTTIYAPISGTIYGLKVEQGERVVGTGQMAGTEILRIANLSRMEVLVGVNENDIIRVSLGDTANIEVDSYIGKIFKGVVTEIANSANTSGGSLDQVTSFNVKILILENQTTFRPGMSATVEIETESKYNVLAVPIQSVTTRVDSLIANLDQDPGLINKDEEEQNANVRPRNELKEVVFIVDETKTKIVDVETGIQDKYYIEILSGLSEGDQVISAPFNAISKKLESGDEIEVVTKEELFAPPKKGKK